MTGSGDNGMSGNPPAIDAERATHPTPKAGHPEVAAVVVLALVLSVSLAVDRSGGRAAPLPVTSYRLTFNPNDAPWWELTVLPRIGESLAKRIVAFRSSTIADAASADGGQAAFTRADDLARVHGIGPKTVARLRSHLHFD